MKGKEWVVTLILGLAAGLVAAGALQKQGDTTEKVSDRHEAILRDHETRISKMEQLGQDTNDSVHELLKRIPQ